METFTSLLGGAEFWEGVALVVFVGVLVKFGVHGMAARALDDQAQKIKDQLSEAEQLRAEAEKLLASIKQEREDAERMSAQILADAQAQAEQISADARVKLDEQVKRRADQAKRKIALAEAQAMAEVKAAAVEMAAGAAETVLAGRVGAKKSDPLIDSGLAQMGQKFG